MTEAEEMFEKWWNENRLKKDEPIYSVVRAAFVAGAKWGKGEGFLQGWEAAETAPRHA